MVLSFNEKPILFKEIKGGLGKPLSEHYLRIWEMRKIGDMLVSDTLVRNGEKYANFGSCYIYNDRVSNTIVSTAASQLIEFNHPNRLSDEKLVQIGSFPTDYNFLGTDVKYLIGMSVPPIMTAQIAHQIYLQWLSKT